MLISQEMVNYKFFLYEYGVDQTNISQEEQLFFQSLDRLRTRIEEINLGRKIVGLFELLQERREEGKRDE